MWELLVALGGRVRPLLAAVVRAGIRLCSRHPRWSGAALGVTVVAGGWSMLTLPTPEPAPTDAARMTGMDGELIPVVPDVVGPHIDSQAGSDHDDSQDASDPFASVSAPGGIERSPAPPLFSPVQPVLHQPPPYRPASVVSSHREEPEAAWLTGAIEEAKPPLQALPPLNRTASRPAATVIPPPWSRD